MGNLRLIAGLALAAGGALSCPVKPAFCPPGIAFCPLGTAFCPLGTAFCPLGTAFCPLHGQAATAGADKSPARLHLMDQ